MLFEDGVEQDNKSLPGFQVRRDTHEVYSDQHPSAPMYIDGRHGQTMESEPELQFSGDLQMLCRSNLQRIVVLQHIRRGA